MLKEHALITRLENKVDELYKDRAIARKIVGSNSKLLLMDTAIEEYVAIKQDLTIPLGIRYLSLSCVAIHYQLYQDDREISQLKDLIGHAINIPAHVEIFSAIQIVKSRYHQIYDCNSHEFDRVEGLIDRMSNNSHEKCIKDNDDLKYPQEKIAQLEDKVKLFKTLFFIVVMFLVGGGSGIILTLLINQQPQPISTNTYQLSTPTPSPSNISLSHAVIATPSPVEAVLPSPSPVAIAVPDPQISEDEAVSLIEKWFEAKKILFAPPFDRELAASLITGKAYTDKVKGLSSDGKPTSASEWLEKNHYYRSYGLQRIDSIEKFEVSGNNAIIDVRVTEHSNLYNSKGQLQNLKSGLETKTIRYILVKEDQNTKISDYNDLKISERK